MAKCEGCGKRATKRDIEGVSLCTKCYGACPHADGCKCVECAKEREKINAKAIRKWKA